MLYPEIEAYLANVPTLSLTEERLEKWQTLATKLHDSTNEGAINFICAHNARRSVLSQSLATVMAFQSNLPNLIAWSGGAEETFVHPNSIAALQRIGFRLESQTKGENPHYLMRYSAEAPALDLFSKKFDDPSSPAPYHAILVCSKGDAACPFIPNVSSRSLIPFEDPGAYDNTPNAEAAYDEAAQVIGQELKHFFTELLAKP